MAQIVWHLLENTSGWQPGMNVLCDNDATIHSGLWNEVLEQGPISAPVLFADQVKDVSGTRDYDFATRSSPTVKLGSGSDELIRKLLEMM
ncbi:MAG: hypothetical protein Q8P67_19825 [archaeon]|nr:hypothetical protein [archaeon]